MMTDAAFDPADLDDIELEFDDVVPVTPAVPASPQKKSRRAPAKGRDVAAEAPAPATGIADTAAPELATEPADPPAAIPQPNAVSTGSPLSDRRQWMLTAIVCLALLTSLMSLGGLIAVGRTLAAAQADRGHAQDDRAALAHVPELVAALDRASTRLAVAPGAAPALSATSAAGGVTSDDLHHSLDALRLAIDARQPAGVGAMTSTLQAGFSEIATRLDRIEAQSPSPAARVRPDPKVR